MPKIWGFFLFPKIKEMETFLSQKIPKNYYCHKCDYTTFNKKDFSKHCLTKKHKSVTQETEGTILETKKSPKYCCDICNNREFKTKSGLWKHKQQCTYANKYCTDQDIDQDNYEDKNKYKKQQDLINYLMKENNEFKQLMIEQNQQMMKQNNQIIELSKNAGHHNNNTNFNLNLYLNETCKNAMNIMDFVNQLQIGNYDLEETGRLGFANGISRIFINALKQINVNDRPIHCSDFKRETLYIKDNDEWNKDSQEKPILTNAIKHVANKNIKQIFEWTKEHPEYNNSKAKANDKYLKIVSESMSGYNQEETNKNYNKIIKNIVKETLIEKSAD